MPKNKKRPLQSVFFYFAIGHTDLALLSCTSAELISSSPTWQRYKNLMLKKKQKGKKIYKFASTIYL
jgi:hypothetical protein